MEKTRASGLIGGQKIPQEKSPFCSIASNKSEQSSKKFYVSAASSTKTNSIEYKSDENSTEVYDDVSEDCGKNSVNNFQKIYLELGQWPEVPVPVFQDFKSKYTDMKVKLKKCRREKNAAQEELRKYKSGQISCRSCSELREKNSKTKVALEQAVQLSTILLKKLKEVESKNSSVDERWSRE